MTLRSAERMFPSVVAFVVTLTIPIAPVFAEDCGFLLSAGQAPPALGDRQLYYHVPGAPGWAKMDHWTADFNGRNVTFAYVVVENFAKARAGVLVIKSGRLRQMNEPAVRRPNGRVQLVRLPNTFNNGACAPVPDFGEKDISAKSYDGYHDQGLNVPDIKTINAFHFQYASRRGGCRRTNDAAADSLAPPDLRSNRSQFSFDPDVVAHGTYSQVMAWFRPTRAYAGSEYLANQRVEMKQYRTVPAQPVCVTFTLAVRGSASFLRINDLEALSQNGLRLRYIRSGEQQWSLSRSGM
jgi:hypothetical protein